jgi:hypothetical protein
MHRELRRVFKLLQFCEADRSLNNVQTEAFVWGENCFHERKCLLLIRHQVVNSEA